MKRFRKRTGRSWAAILPGMVAYTILFALAGLARVAAADQVGVIDLPYAAKAHHSYLTEADTHTDRIDLAPTGADREAIEAQQKRLKALRERLARERSSLSQAEKQSLEQAITDESAALQVLHAKNTKEKYYDRLRWRSPDVFFSHLTERLKEYGGETGLALIVNKMDDRPIYRDPARPRDSAGERVDLTQSFIGWLRSKDGPPPEGAQAPPGR